MYDHDAVVDRDVYAKEPTYVNNPMRKRSIDMNDVDQYDEPRNGRNIRTVPHGQRASLKDRDLYVDNDHNYNQRNRFNGNDQEDE